MRRLVCTLALTVFILCASLSLLPAQRTGSLKATVHAIRDARVVLEAGKILPKATVVIRDGVIEAVGADVKVPADAVVIEGKGLTVYPGFVDAMSNWGFDAAQRRSAVGEPGTEDLASDALAATKPDNRKGITPEFHVRTALKADADMAEAWRRVGVTAHLVAPEGGILGGQSALVSLSGAPSREAVLASPVAQHLAFQIAGGGRPRGGPPAITPNPMQPMQPGQPGQRQQRQAEAGRDYPRVLMGIIAHTRQTLLDAGHHARLLSAFEANGRKGKRPPADPSLESLAPVLQGKMPVVIEADSRDQIDRALDFAAEFKLRPIIYGGQDAWKCIDRLKRDKVPVMLRLDFTDAKSPLVSAREKEMPQRVKDAESKKRLQEIACANVLHQAGVLFAFCTQGLTGERPQDRFRTNINQAIAAGLSADAALVALTTAPARILGVEGQLGSVSKGKAAHLLVTTGDVFATGTRIRHVFADGVRFDIEAEDRTIARKGGAKKKDPSKKEDAPAIKDESVSELDEDRKPAIRTGGSVLLKSATVLPVSRGPLPDTDILVMGGKITAIGKDLKAPDGVQVLDLKGMFVMPGIIDTHCHFAVSGGVNEFSLSVVPEVRVRDVINSEDVQIYRALAGGVTTARLLHGSANVIGGQDAVIKLKYGRPAHDLLVSTGPRGVKFALGENVKRTDGRFPNTRLGVEAVLVRAFTEARDYRRNWDAYERAKAEGKPVAEPRRDLRLEALADILAGKLHVHCHCYRADEILMLLRVAKQFGFKVRSLQHVLEGYKVAAEIAEHGASCSPFSDWWAYKWEAAEAIPHCAALLHEAGVSVCLKSDSNELMRHMYQEAAKTVKYGGLDETTALRLISLNAAKQLGIDKRTGSIEIGKDADLAIFNGHPLNSYARCEMTLVEGEVYFQRPGKLTPFAAAAAAPAPANGTPKPLPHSAERVLLTNATVHPVTGPVMQNATIEIRKGQVHDIRATSADDARDPARYDATGLHISPGMIDAASVIGLIEVDSARETRDHAEGGDFQPDLRASTAINPDSELIPVTRANGVTAVLTRPTGGVIAGQSALVNLAGWVPREMALVDPLGLHVELPGGIPGIGRGSPFGRASLAINRRTRDQKLRKLEELFRQALVHDRARQDNPETPGNPRLEALIPYAKGERQVFIQASRRADILEALKLADKLKVKMVLTGGIEAWKVADELKKRDIPVVLGPVLTLPSSSHDPYDAAFACAAKLHQAGVRFCIRSTGDSNTRNLPYHAAMAVSYGLPPEEGLKSVTLYPAQILGVADRLGSIGKGRTANLVLATGDVLQASTQVVGLYINGKPLAATSKHTRLYERYRQRLKEVREGKAPLGTR
jgi:imidazolonepropionase-like amidohydrolase